MKNLTYLFLAPLLMATLLFSSCEKEVLSPGEEMAIVLQAEVDAADITVATVYYSGNRVQTQKSFSFSGNLVHVGKAYYNLEKLTLYQIIKYTNGVNELQLYFD